MPLSDKSVDRHSRFQIFKLFSFVLAIGLAVCAFSIVGCGGNKSKSKRIILLTNGDDPFWDAMRVGMEKAEKDFGLSEAGLSVVMDKNDGTAGGQVEKLKQYLGQTDIAAVGISVIDPQNSAMADAMRELRKQGVVVVTIDSDVDRSKFKDTRFGYLGTANVVGGRQMGKAAKALRPDGGKYATFYGIEGVSNVIERNDGFAEGAGDKFKKAVGMADKMDHSVAQDNVRSAMQNHPDITTLVGIWAYDAHAIVLGGERTRHPRQSENCRLRRGPESDPTPQGRICRCDGRSESLRDGLQGNSFDERALRWRYDLRQRALSRSRRNFKIDSVRRRRYPQYQYSRGRPGRLAPQTG